MVVRGGLFLFPGTMEKSRQLFTLDKLLQTSVLVLAQVWRVVLFLVGFVVVAQLIVHLSLPDPATIDPNFHRSSEWMMSEEWIRAEEKMDLYLLCLFLLAGIAYIYMHYRTIYKKAFCTFQRVENLGFRIRSLLERL